MELLLSNITNTTFTAKKLLIHFITVMISTFLLLFILLNGMEVTIDHHTQQTYPTWSTYAAA